MKEIHTENTKYYSFDVFSKHKDIKHFVSLRIKKKVNKIYNNFNISLEAGMPYKEVILNRKLLSKDIEIPLENFVMQNQIHGDNITTAEERHRGKGILNHNTAIQNSDALITDKKNICLFLFVADCMTILFFDTKKKVIAAAHSGWKGTVLKIAQKTALKMIKEYNSSPADIIVGIGPSISVKKYEVGENVVTEVEKAFGTKENYLHYNSNSKKFHFNLLYAAEQQLADIGIPPENIELPDFCTFENNDLFFSARKKNTGRFGAGIMLL